MPTSLTPASLLLAADNRRAGRPLWALARSDVKTWAETRTAAERAWLAANAFEGAAGDVLLMPGGDGGIGGALVGLGNGTDIWIGGALATKLPAGDWVLEGRLPAAQASNLALAFVLGGYRFERYRAPSKEREEPARLVAPEGVNRDALLRVADAVWRVRDLVNTPPNDMGPAELEEAARAAAARMGAKIRVVTGADLPAQNFPLVQAVGAGSPRAPRLIDITWTKPGGRADAPKVTLVGKGVCFDTGGLNIKPDSAMALMKKDMAGAAHALALGECLAVSGLDLRLRIVVPAVENSVSGNAMRPSDVVKSRKGITVEIGNTDAEGRLVLADALALADEDAPDLLLDFATLTGAARTALGPEIIPFYTDDDAFAAELAEAAAETADPVWRMPLWKGYASGLESRVADTNNISDGAFAGSIVAALFLQKFVEKAKTWVHFDIYGWSSKARPGRPQGGEAQTIRALFAALSARYGG